MTQRRQAFTLVELLVVIGIIALLIGLLLPVIGKARAQARQIKAMSSLRELLNGYQAYSLANRGALLWGYTQNNVDGWPVTATDPRTGFVLTSNQADRYPWRLLPYCSNVWQIIHGHDEVPPIPGSISEPDIWFKCYYLSLNPTFGINATYVGGHKDFDGFLSERVDNKTVYRPNTGKHVAFRASEIRRSSQQIIFADSQCFNAPDQVGKGLNYLTPPRARGQNWEVKDGKFVLKKGTIMGLPKGWFTKYATVGFFDGHVQNMLPAELEDMRLWSPRADSPTWDYLPSP